MPVHLSSRLARRALGAALVLPAWPLGAQILPIIPPLATLPTARVSVDAQRGVLLIELPPTDLPASTPRDESMVSLPAYQVRIPLDLALASVRVDVLDSAGYELPRTFLHHLTLTDPGRRELFLSTQLHILAVSKETPTIAMPALLLGMPLPRGERLLTIGMLTNPTRTAHHGVRIRATLGYRRLGFFPLFQAFPWGMDAMFPLGHPPDGTKGFDLAPGRTVRYWDSSPAVPGYLIGIGGHMHDYGVSLELADMTTGQVLWHGTPVRDSAGHVLSMPTTWFHSWHSVGIHIEPTHRYRISATYENPTGHLLPDGGMGAIGGLFVPDRGTHWPAVDSTNAVYRQDLYDVVVSVGSGQAMAMP
ncbi:MAG TPA: hypothetical protein VNV25_17900 [Gemmatimonadaceae bacterium]|nr:hypothetical protein [Gemmatimonadaceae bacterium]